MDNKNTKSKNKKGFYTALGISFAMVLAACAYSYFQTDEKEDFSSMEATDVSFEEATFEEAVPEEGFEADPADGLEAEPDDGFSVSAGVSSAGVSSRGLTVILTGASVEFPLSSVATRIMLYSPGFEKSGASFIE